MILSLLLILFTIITIDAFIGSKILRTNNAILNTYPIKKSHQSSHPLHAKPKGSKEGSKDEMARQLMGIKGGGETTDIWKIRLQLCKPVTWIPLIWGVACGAAASGNYHTFNPFGANDLPLDVYAEDAFKAFTCMILSGPILTGKYEYLSKDRI